MKTRKGCLVFKSDGLMGATVLKLEVYISMNYHLVGRLAISREGAQISIASCIINDGRNATRVDWIKVHA